MTREKATRQGCYQRRVNVVGPVKAHDAIIADNWERGTLAGGLLIAVSFGLMLVYGAVMF